VAGQSGVAALACSSTTSSSMGQQLGLSSMLVRPRLTALPPCLPP
jgi:hypothetical protein